MDGGVDRRLRTAPLAAGELGVFALVVLPVAGQSGQPFAANGSGADRGWMSGAS